MTVELSQEMQKEMGFAIREFGYRSDREFVEDALKRRILDLRKADFLAKAKLVREKLVKRGVSPDDVLDDFDKYRHQK